MLATNAGLLTPILGDPSPWNPERLYINGEAGAWYDPGDLTAEKVAWRRNLLTWSEQFDNAAWEKTNATVTANAGVAPDGTTTADLVFPTTSGTLRGAYQGITLSAGAYTQFLYVKASGKTAVGFIEFNGSLVGCYVNLTTGVASGVLAGYTVTVTNAGSGWWQIALTATVTAGTRYLQFLVLDATGSTSVTANGSDGVLVWGAQINPGTTASAYQRITDFTSDFLAAFPTHALYQDAAGTTPVTVLGQPVGLALDKSRGALANVGSELVTGGNFESGLIGTKVDGSGSVSTWALNTTAPISGTQDGRLTITTGASGRPLINFSSAVPSLVNNSFYLLTFDYKLLSGTFIVESALLAGVLVSGVNRTLTGSGTFRLLMRAGSDTTDKLYIYAGSLVCDVQIDNLSVRLVPGVHAIQPTSASRPALDARVNLLTRTEEFDNAAWTKLGATITANAAVAPDGTTTADLMYATTNQSFVYAEQQPAGGSAIWTLSAYIKASGKSVAWMYLNNVGANGIAYFDASDATIQVTAGSASSLTATMVAVGSGWFRCTVTTTVPIALTAGVGKGIGVSNAKGTTSFTANGTDGMFIWGADLRLATDAAYPYQRVVTATDYADVGVPRSFLHDGFDDSSYTASSLDLSGTDKVTVWAGVYKNSNTGVQVILEHGPDTSAVNDGVFVLGAEFAGAQDYAVQARGTARNARQYTTYAAPSSDVISAQMTTVAANSADALQVRVDGVTNAGVGVLTAASSGNFSSRVFNIGRRNNASLPFNGKIYTIIIRGGVTDAATLALTERYVGSRMGIVL